MVSNFNIKAIKIITLLMVILIISCETEEVVKYDIFEYEKKLVIQGFISADEGIKVTVSKSLPPLTLFTDTIDITVKGAKVRVIAESIPLFFLQEIEPGYFVSPDTFVAKNSTGYQLEVTADGFPRSISGIQYLPVEPQIDSGAIILEGYSTYIQFKFCDYDINKNHYYFTRYIYHQGNEDAEDYFNSKNPYYPMFDPGSIISDNMFNGRCYEIRDWLPTMSTDYADTIMADSVKVSLFTLSDALVNYLESLDEWESTKDDMWQEIPVNIHSNINGGYGIFASYAKKSIMLKLAND